MFLTRNGKMISLVSRRRKLQKELMDTLDEISAINIEIYNLKTVEGEFNR